MSYEKGFSNTPVFFGTRKEAIKFFTSDEYLKDEDFESHLQKEIQKLKIIRTLTEASEEMKEFLSARYKWKKNTKIWIIP